MKVYIAGPMSGYPNYNFPAFRQAAAFLREQGHDVVSPAELDEKMDKFDGTGEHPVKNGYPYYMKRDLQIVTECDAIYMLAGWENSRGAFAEYACARACGLQWAWWPSANFKPILESAMQPSMGIEW